jgi:hypothetical protein
MFDAIYHLYYYVLLVSLALSAGTVERSGKKRSKHAQTFQHSRGSHSQLNMVILRHNAAIVGDSNGGTIQNSEIDAIFEQTDPSSPTKLFPRLRPTKKRKFLKRATIHIRTLYRTPIRTDSIVKIEVLGKNETLTQGGNRVLVSQKKDVKPKYSSDRASQICGSIMFLDVTESGCFSR